MSWITIACVSFLSGLTASLGLGGGMVLLVYLTVFAGMEQLQAQGINLLFFLPIAAVSLIIHSKAGRIKWRKLFPAMISGAIFALAFSYAANYFGSDIIRKAFGVIILIIGIKELFHKKEKAVENPQP